jgi:hypothetical protein
MCTLATPNPAPKVETTYTGGSGKEDLASPSCPVRSAEGERERTTEKGEQRLNILASSIQAEYTCFLATVDTSIVNTNSSKKASIFSLYIQ